MTKEVIDLFWKEQAEHNINAFHDVVVEARNFDTSLDNHELLEIFKALPDDVQHTAFEWSLSDTVFRDKVYDYLKSLG